jgi:GntR family transcriptional regulator/MocR family aminotransferase
MSALARHPLDMPTLLNLARRVDVGLYPLAPFHHFGPPRDGLLMGFGVIAAQDIDPALDRVRAVLEQMA